MKKGDLEVGVEYAVTHGKIRVPSEGLAGLKTFGYGSDVFPTHAVSRVRIEGIDLPYEIKTGFQGERTKIEKMIQVIWLDNPLRPEGMKNERPRGRFVYHADPRMLRGAAHVLCTWAEYEVEYAKHKAIQEETKRNDSEAESQRERVLARVAALGITAEEGRGFSTVEITASELERLLNLRLEG